jgi:hypothetical protein
MDYEILGVSSSSSTADIKRAYYKLALKYHPDRNPSGGDQFRRINEAYTRLTQSVPVMSDQSLDSYIRELFGDHLVDYVIHLGEGLMRPTIHLSPTLDDLFLQKVFLYKVGHETYPIPLWHHELQYETFDVVCTCRFDGKIDSENNIHVDVFTPLVIADVSFKLGKHDFQIPSKDLRVVRTQTIRLVGKGIPRIHETCCLDASCMADIVVTVTFI